MDFDLSDEQQMLRDSAERYLRDNYNFETFRAIANEENAISESQWQAMAEMGWLLVELPEALGGLGCSFLETAVLVEELGRAMVLEPVMSTAVIGAHMLLQAGTPQQQALLGDLAAGKLRLALACEEAGGRYSLDADLVTRAEAVDGGYQLDGHKTVVLDAPSAHKLIVSASVGGELGLFLVDSDAEGVMLSSYPLINSARASDISFSGTRLDSSALLCAGAEATALLQEVCDRAVLAQAAMSLGAMEKVLDVCAEYLQTRQQFGQPIGKFQALQHRMSEMFVEVQASRSALYHGLAHIGAAAPERSVAMSQVKVTVAKAAHFVGAQGIQLHGGIGLTEEYPIGHYFRYFTFLEKSYGDRDYHLRNIAKSYRAAH